MYAIYFLVEYYSTANALKKHIAGIMFNCVPVGAGGRRWFVYRFCVSLSVVYSLRLSLCYFLRMPSIANYARNSFAFLRPQFRLFMA